MFPTPKDVNDAILLALSSPLGLLVFLVCLIALAVVGTWFVRGWFDQFIKWKVYKADQDKRKIDDEKIHQNLKDTVEANSAGALSEVRKVGKEFLELMTRDHHLQAEMMRTAAEELGEVSKANAKNAQDIASVVGQVQAILQMKPGRRQKVRN